MVAASSYQKDGRLAPAKLTAAAETATISGSSNARGFAIKRLRFSMGARLLTRESAPRLAHPVRRRPGVPAVVADQRRSFASYFDGVRLLAWADLPVGVLGGQVVQLVDGGFVIGHERGLADNVTRRCGHPLRHDPGGERAQAQ